MGRIRGRYNAEYPVGSLVRVADREHLERFIAEWNYHHPLTKELLDFAGCVTVVTNVGYYHGGSELYELSGLPGIWHEQCLRAANSYE
jgi:hypothetical protein